MIFRFRFETEVLEIDTKKFLTNEEEILPIMEWFRNRESENQLTVAEIKLFKNFERDDERQKYLRVLFEESGPEWVAVKEIVIKEVPFLKLACSERWNQNGDAYSPVTITTVPASSLKFLSFYCDAEMFPTNSLLKDLFLDSFVMGKLSRQVVNDLDFLRVLGVRDQELLSSEGDFNLVETCNRIQSGDTEAATKLLLAAKLEWFNGKSLDPIARDKVFDAFLYIVSNPTFNDNFVLNTKHLYDHFDFNCIQIEELDTAETNRYKNSDDDTSDDDTSGDDHMIGYAPVFFDDNIDNFQDYQGR